MILKHFEIPPGIEAAALRFAKACKRDGYGEHTAIVRVRDGLPRYVDIYDADGTQHFCEYMSGDWYELLDIDGDDDE